MSKNQLSWQQKNDNAKNLIINQINAGQNIDTNNLDTFLKNGGDINKWVLRNADDQTFLSLAIEKDNHHAINILIASGASVNQTALYDDQGFYETFSLLNRAIHLNKSYIVYKLLEAGAELDISGPIRDVIANNKTEILTVMLDYYCFHDARSVKTWKEHYRNNIKFDLLKNLIQFDKTDLVTRIVNTNKINLNFQGPGNNYDSDRLLLNIAIKQGNFKLVELFGEKGANFEETANNSLMSLAVTRSTTPEEKINRLEIVKLLINKGLKADFSSMHDAIINGYADMLELLVQNSSEAVNYQELFETATLNFYCEDTASRVQIIKLCLKNGLKLTQGSFKFIRESFFRDPESKLALVKLLVEEGDISAINKMDLFNLAATSQNCFEVVQYLKTQFHLDLNGVDSKGDNPLESFVKTIEHLKEPDSNMLEFLLQNMKPLDQEGRPILAQMRIDGYKKKFANHKEILQVAKFLIAKEARVTQDFITNIVESKHAQLLKVLIEENAQDHVTQFNVKEYFFTGEGSSLVHKFDNWSFSNQLYSLFLRECDNLKWLAGFQESHIIHAQIKLANSLFNLEDLANYSTNDFSYNHDFVQARLEYHLKDKDLSFLKDFQEKLINKYSNNEELCKWLIPIVQEKINITIENEALDVILPSIVAELSGILPMPIGLILEHPSSAAAGFGVKIDQAKLEQTLAFYKKDLKLKNLIEQYEVNPSSALISKINIAAREVLENYIADNLENLQNYYVAHGISQINDLTHVKLPEKLMDKIYEVIEHHNESMEVVGDTNDTNVI